MIIKFINSVLNRKIKIFNFSSFIVILTLFLIFDIDVQIKLFPANMIFFMSFSNLMLVIYKKQQFNSNNEKIKDFKSLLVSGILISLLSLFVHIVNLLFVNKIFSVLYTTINLMLTSNILYVSLLLINVSNILMTENLKDN